MLGDEVDADTAPVHGGAAAGVVKGRGLAPGRGPRPLIIGGRVLTCATHRGPGQRAREVIGREVGRLGVICFRFRLRGNVETVAVKTTSSQVWGRGSTIVKITPTAKMEHEATTSSIGEDQLFYCNQRGINLDDAVSMIVNGFCKEVFAELPMEFAVEAKQLIEVTLENSVG